MWKKLRAILGVLLILGVLAACQQSRETRYLMEVTREVPVYIVVTATPGHGESSVAAQTPGTGSPVLTTTLTPTVTLSPDSTALDSIPESLPTPVNEQIVVAEQAFERGRMFYLQPRGEIWVMVNTTTDGSSGTWTFHPDEWAEGMPEFDPELAVPEGLVQPRRGFGKLWRENAAIRNALGWALETEFGHWTTYEYYFGGDVNAEGEYIPGPGQHVLYSREGVAFIFEENDGTWRRVDLDATS